MFTVLRVQLLDEFQKQDEEERAAERLKHLMADETKAGALAPELDYKAANLHKKPTSRQRQALQGLRNLLVCVWSEAARYGPERCDPVRQNLHTHGAHRWLVGFSAETTLSSAGCCMWVGLADRH